MAASRVRALSDEQTFAGSFGRELDEPVAMRMDEETRAFARQLAELVRPARSR